MAKKIVQLENNDGDQIFPISATDIALPGTKVAMRSASDSVTISTTRVSIVSTTVDSDGDYLAIGSVAAGTGSQDVLYCYAFIDNGTDNTTYVTNISTIASGRPCMTVMGKITGLHQGDTVRLSAQTQGSSYTTNGRDQSLALIKLPTGAPTYKGGALVVNLTGGTWSGATEMEIFNAVRNGKPVVLQGAVLDSGSALLLSMNTSVRSSWGSFLTNEGRTYRIIFNSDNTYSIIDMTTAESYSTSEEATGGTWVDGKPIYKKTVRFSLTATDHTEANVSTGISNGETLVDIRGRLTANATGNQYPIPFGEPGQWQVMVRSISSGLGTVKLQCNAAAVLNNVSGEFTLYYTKTTV